MTTASATSVFFRTRLTTAACLAGLTLGVGGCQEISVGGPDEDPTVPFLPWLGASEAGVLIVLDQSSSMAAHAQAADEAGEAATAAFFSRLFPVTDNWRVGLLTDGPCMVDGGFGPLTRDLAGTLLDAARVADEREESWARETPAQGPPTWNLTGAVPPGEKLLERVVDAFDVQGVGGCNAGFFAEDTPLHVVFVTDAPDRSEVTADEALQVLFDATGTAAGRMQVHAMVPLGACGEDDGPGLEAHREMAERTGGQLLDLCSDPWTESLQYVAAALVLDLLTAAGVGEPADASR